MISYPSQAWPDVISFYDHLARDTPALAPMAAFVHHLAASPYSAGLHPVTSMQTLRLFQHDHVEGTDEEVRVDFEDGAFVVRYRAGATPDPRFALRPPPGVWTKRGPDGIALLERAFHHLRWLVEYRPAV
jgi:hypothetical protein